MKKLYSWITEHTGLFLVGFLILTVVCTALKPLIGVNYDMNVICPRTDRKIAWGTKNMSQL